MTHKILFISVALAITLLFGSRAKADFLGPPGDRISRCQALIFFVGELIAPAQSTYPRAPLPP